MNLRVMEWSIGTDGGSREKESDGAKPTDRQSCRYHRQFMGIRTRR